MPCIADIDVFCMRHKSEKFLDMRFLNEFGGSTTYQQHRNLNSARCFLQRPFELMAIRVGGARTVKKAWIPMPTPAAVGRSA